MTIAGYSWGGLLALLLHGRGAGGAAGADLPPAWRAAREKFEERFGKRNLDPEFREARKALRESGLRERDPDAYQRRIFELSVAPYFYDPRSPRSDALPSRGAHPAGRSGPAWATSTSARGSPSSAAFHRSSPRRERSDPAGGLPGHRRPDRRRRCIRCRAAATCRMWKRATSLCRWSATSSGPDSRPRITFASMPARPRSTSCSSLRRRRAFPNRRQPGLRRTRPADRDAFLMDREVITSCAISARTKAWEGHGPDGRPGAPPTSRGPPAA